MADEQDWAAKEARRCLCVCTCLEAYKGRKLVDPQCVPCNYADEVADALRAAERRGEEAMREKAARKTCILCVEGSPAVDGWHAGKVPDTFCPCTANAIRTLPTD